MKCTSNKEVWHKLKNVYEGDEKFTKEKLQIHSREFEMIKMRDEENIASYIIHVDEISNAFKGLGVQMTEEAVIQKMFRTLLPRFESKVLVLEVEVI